MKIEGRCHWACVKRGKVTKFSQTPIDNLVLDSGLNMVATNLIANLFVWACIGSDNSPSQRTQTSLISETDRTNVLFGGEALNGTTLMGRIYEMSRCFYFAPATASHWVGEIGFLRQGAALEPLFSRIFMKNPISVDEGEELIIRYTLKVVVGPMKERLVKFPITSDKGPVVDNGRIQLQQLGLSSVDSAGYTVAFDGGGYSGEPSFASEAFMSPSGEGLGAFGYPFDRTQGSIIKECVPSPYTLGSFQLVKTAIFDKKDSLMSQVWSAGMGPLGSSPKNTVIAIRFNTDFKKSSGGEFTFRFKHRWGINLNKYSNFKTLQKWLPEEKAASRHPNPIPTYFDLEE